MPLADFHPAIADWFRRRFGTPTEPQARGWPAIQSGLDTLIAAPTGSGKTLAAFLASLNQLYVEGLAGGLRDEISVVYVSPLKALSNDIHKNLEEPLAGIRASLKASLGQDIEIRSAVRTGDTPASRRQAIMRRPPHILVTTPESLYLLLTSAGGRRSLGKVRTLIIDEIHAVAGNRRGSHLALSVERLTALVPGPLQRIALSATQKPIGEVARFLVGTAGIDPDGTARAAIIDCGAARDIDLAIELPGAPLEAVMSNEVWTEIYGRLAQLVSEHHTTLLFVNTRRLAERVAAQLGERLGRDAVMSHHGSLSAKIRLEAENRLKQGKLKALVATASLELGIDIGSVDLVCQIGSTRSIATLLQRAGRAGHRRGGLPKARLFPLSRDELIDTLAAVRCVRKGELDRLEIPSRPLDVLAQQIVACAACEEWDEERLYGLVRKAYPYRDLDRKSFDSVVQMLAEGFSTKRGRRGALIHHDGVNRRIRGRRGAAIVALTSGGAIPDNSDFRVLVEPGETFIGTVNEDFAVESLAGDIFQLGNASWKILRINSGTVRVEDAHGQPPGVPVWLGEAPGRSDELSEAVSLLRREAESLIEPAAGYAAARDALVRWLANEPALPPSGAEQLADYLVAVHRTLGAIPSSEKLVIERFFDESGGMQLVLHSPFGSRMNRAWGLALRKRFCRSFNFELQAAATDDAIVISLGTQHSFALEEVFRYLNSRTVRDLLIQAVLDAPMFQVRWRWNASRALALPRQRGGHKIAAPLQRMESENLLAAVFPDQLACPENLVGDREVPGHPLVSQTLEDCLGEAMDIDALIGVIRRIETGGITCIARDVPEPSPLAHEVLNARPYAFLDDAPLEERRTRAVYLRRASDPASGGELGILDAAAIEKVCQEAWPDPANADELHDALLLLGVMKPHEIADLSPDSAHWLEQLSAARRAVRFGPFWTAAERLPLVASAYPPAIPDSQISQAYRELVTYCITNPPAPLPRESTRELVTEYVTNSDAGAARREISQAEAIRELVRGRLEACGPVTQADLNGYFLFQPTQVEAALLALEGEGFALRGRFKPEADATEWCDRRLLARIHRLTINRLRAEIQPVSIADYQRFLSAWHRLDAGHRAEGLEETRAVIEMLDGYELPAGAWEPHVLASRVNNYDPAWLDLLCFSGSIGWGRLNPPRLTGTGSDDRPDIENAGLASRVGSGSSGGGRFPAPVRSSPLALFSRENLPHWLALSQPPETHLSREANQVLDTLGRHGALFFQEIVRRTALLPTVAERALGELAALGFVTGDGFEGMRALLAPERKRKSHAEAGTRRAGTAPDIGHAGRWSVLRTSCVESLPERDQSLEVLARVLLRRYGIMFRRMLDREPFAVTWLELVRVYRRLEARGEIRGGHFVGGVSGEQFALPEAIASLRTVRRTTPSGELLSISAADPLNLAGILSPGTRIPALAPHRLLLRDGNPIAALKGREAILLASEPPTPAIDRALRVGSLPPSLRRYYA